MKLRVLAFDPGTSKTGYAILDIVAKPVVATYVVAEQIPNDFDAFRKLIADPSIDIVALEELESYGFSRKKKDGSTKRYGSEMVGHLMKSKGTEREIGTIARVLGKPVVSITARKVRSLFGVTKDGDAGVRDVVLRFVRKWPATSNNHERDAGALALAVGWMRAV